MRIDHWMEDTLLTNYPNLMRSFVATSVILLLVCGMLAQSNQKASVVEDNANACELNSAYVDSFRSSLSDDSTAFIIFRAGTGESDAFLNRRFLRVSRFLRHSKGLGGERINYVRGEKVKGKGRIEFYKGGLLFFVILAKQGRIPCMDYQDRPVYP
jgi:hypothetical protein